MKTEDAHKMQLVQFIKLNDRGFTNTNFNSYTLTELVILKTEIELSLLNKNDFQDTLNRKPKH